VNEQIDGNLLKSSKSATFQKKIGYARESRDAELPFLPASFFFMRS